MSWIKTAVNKAVKVGGRNKLRRTVWSFADLAESAVISGARIIHNRNAGKNVQNLQITVKRLEEVSISCKGVERVQLLRRWLVALKEIDRLFNDENNSNNNNNSDITDDNDDENVNDRFSYEDIKDSSHKPTLVYYYDPEMGEPMNFREVFLYSQALEGMTLSMVNPT